MMTFQPGFSVLFSSVNSCLSLLYLPRIFKLFFMKRNLFSEPSNVFSLQFFKQHSSRSLSCYSECKSAHQLRTQRAVGRGNNTRTDSLGTVEIGQQFTVRILNQVPPPPLKSAQPQMYEIVTATVAPRRMWLLFKMYRVNFPCGCLWRVCVRTGLSIQTGGRAGCVPLAGEDCSLRKTSYLDLTQAPHAPINHTGLVSPPGLLQESRNEGKRGGD